MWPASRSRMALSSDAADPEHHGSLPISCKIIGVKISYLASSTLALGGGKARSCKP